MSMIQRNNFRTRFSHKQGSYDRLKNQLESQNAMLMKQRKRLQTRSNLNVYQNPITPNPVIKEQSGFSSYSSPLGEDKSNSKIEAICSKIEEILDICSENYNLNQIANAEKRILSYLTTPQRSPQRDSLKLTKPRNTHEENHNKQSNKKLIRDQINKKGFEISDEIMQVIESIQRKALIQIQNLRIEKITLLQKLNQEIKNNNQLQKRNYVQQSRIRKRRQENVRSRQRIVGQNNTLENIEEVDEENLLSSARERDRSTFLRQDKRFSQPAKHERFSKNQERSPTFNQNLQRNSLAESSKNLKVRAPGQLIQSLQFNEDLHPPFPSPIIVNSEIEIQKQINNLRQQNIRIRNAISQHQISNASPLKSNLRYQLKLLQQKASNYSDMLTGANKSNALIPNYDNNEELETLFLQSNNLIEQGRRLMKVRSNPNLRQASGYPRWNSNQFQPKIYSNPVILS